MKLPAWGESRVVKVGDKSFSVPIIKRFSESELSTLAKLSRAARSRKLRVLCGLCAQCGKEPLTTTSKLFGKKCLLYMRDRARVATGVTKPYKD